MMEYRYSKKMYVRKNVNGHKTALSQIYTVTSYLTHYYFSFYLVATTLHKKMQTNLVS